MRRNRPSLLRGAAALALAVCASINPVAEARQEPAAKPQTASPVDEPNKPLTASEIEALGIERLLKLKGKKPADWTAEEFVEVVALTYFGGRWRLTNVASSGREEGRITLVTQDGEKVGEYTKRFVYGANTTKDRMRLDLILETAAKPEDHLRYTVTYNGATVWTAQNNSYMQTEASTANAFRAALMNDYTALFRYQEDGATLKRLGVKKMVGLDTEGVELTRPDGVKVRFFVSAKTYRILHVEYDLQLLPDAPITSFRESYFDWRVVQQTVVPGVRKLRMNDQIVQTMTIGNATYGITLDDGVFLQL